MQISLLIWFRVFSLILSCWRTYIPYLAQKLMWFPAKRLSRKDFPLIIKCTCIQFLYEIDYSDGAVVNLSPVTPNTRRGMKFYDAKRSIVLWAHHSSNQTTPAIIFSFSIEVIESKWIPSLNDDDVKLEKKGGSEKATEDGLFENDLRRHFQHFWGAMHSW